MNYTKVPPQSIDAEMSVIGSLILDHRTIPTVTEILQAEDFYTEKHREIFTSILEMFTSGQAVDMALLIAKLEDNGQLEKVGGCVYLTTCMESTPTPRNARDYALKVKEKSALRDLIKHCSAVTNNCYSFNGNIAEFMSEVEDNTLKITRDKASLACRSRIERSGNDIIAQVKAAKEELNERLESEYAFAGHETGFGLLDYVTGGLPRNEITALCARPGVGKTSLATQIAINDCELHKGRPLILSLEMDSTRLLWRMASQLTGVPEYKIRQPKSMSGAEKRAVDSAMEWIDTTGLTILDRVGSGTNGATPQNIIAAIRYSHSVKNHTIIAIDNTQQIINTDSKRSQVYFVQDFFSSMVSLANELKTPILILSQLRRTNRETDERPTMNDIRDSGGIEQCAALALAIHRPFDGYDNTGQYENAEVLIMKNRYGGMGIVPMLFEKQCVRFADKREHVI